MFGNFHKIDEGDQKKEEGGVQKALEVGGV